MLASCLLAAAVAPLAQGFYLPGVAPRTFRYGDRVSPTRWLLFKLESYEHERHLLLVQELICVDWVAFSLNNIYVLTG